AGRPPPTRSGATASTRPAGSRSRSCSAGWPFTSAPSAFRTACSPTPSALLPHEPFREERLDEAAVAVGGAAGDLLAPERLQRDADRRRSRQVVAGAIGRGVDAVCGFLGEREHQQALHGGRLVPDAREMVVLRPQNLLECRLNVVGKRVVTGRYELPDGV